MVAPSPSSDACPPRSPHRSTLKPSLSQLPDDVLLRIISLTGLAGDQVGAAYRLGAVSSRFRRLLKLHFLTSITQLTNDYLRALSLAHAPAARAALSAMFASTPAVRELNLGGCSPTLLSSGCVNALAAAASASLMTVNLAYCRVTDDVVGPLLRCPNLKSLSLPSCTGLTGGMFAHEGNVAPLEFLDVSWVHTLTREGVRAIASVGTLKDLVLTGCEAVNTRTLRAFTMTDVRYSLTSICLSYCPLKDAALLELVRCSPNIRKLILAEATLNLWSVGNFTTNCIEEIKAKYPHVEVIFKT